MAKQAATIKFKANNDGKISEKNYIASDINIIDYREAVKLQRMIIAAEQEDSEADLTDKNALFKKFDREDAMLEQFLVFIIKLYKNQFTYQEAIEGLDPRDLPELLTEQLNFVMGK